MRSKRHASNLSSRNEVRDLEQTESLPKFQITESHNVHFKSGIWNLKSGIHPWLRLPDRLAHLADRFGVVGCFENPRARHDYFAAGIDDTVDVVDFDTAIDLHQD
jgi:hypothetical protein